MRRKIVRIIQACELSEPILRYIFTNGTAVPRASVRINGGVRISQGEIIRAILYLTSHLKSFVFQQIKAIANTGAKVIVTGGKVGDLALHYCNKYKLLVVRLMSKWDLRRLCKAINATPLPRIVSIYKQGCC